jgi:dCMP deaminase
MTKDPWAWARSPEYLERQRFKDHTYLEMARLQARLSKDPRHQVGAVVLNADGKLRGGGYNGFAPGVADTEERLNDKEVKLEMALHAEENALDDAGKETRDGTIYVTKFPCPLCAARIVRSRIRRVVIPEGAETALAPDWALKRRLVHEQFDEAGVEVVEL